VRSGQRAAPILDVPHEWQASKVMASTAGLLLNATRTPLETADKIGTRTSPPG
jgi:hypothetical protein